MASRIQMLFNRFSLRVHVYTSHSHADRQIQKKTCSAKAVPLEWIRLCSLRFKTPVTHGICFRTTYHIYIPQYLCHCYLYARSFIILCVVYFMRCVIYFFCAFVFFPLWFSYKLKHDRQSCRRQLCHLAGYNNKIKEPHTHANETILYTYKCIYQCKHK